MTAPRVPRERDAGVRASVDACPGRAPAMPRPVLAASSGFSDLPEFAGLRAAFVASLGARLAQMRAALDRKDPAAARQAAHMLKGAAASFGFPQTGAAAAQFERSCHAADLAGSRAAMAALSSAVRAEATAAVPEGASEPNAACAPTTDSGGRARHMLGCP